MGSASSLEAECFESPVAFLGINTVWVVLQRQSNVGEVDGCGVRSGLVADRNFDPLPQKLAKGVPDKIRARIVDVLVTRLDLRSKLA